MLQQPDLTYQEHGDGRPGHAAAVAVLLATGLGLALRLAAARGAWGLDEITSLRVAGGLPHVGDAFWGLAYDNNHPLNTAAMVLLGPNRPVWVYRTMSVAFGTLTIPAVALLFWKQDRVAAAVGALFAAVALPLVDFGSEARGYAGLVLASVLAISFWREALKGDTAESQGGTTARFRWFLGLSAAFGAINHVGMMLTTGILVLATVFHLAGSTRRARTTVVGTFRMFLPTGVCMLPAAVAFAVAIRRCGSYRFGDVDPFTPGKLLSGFGDLLGLSSGMPDGFPALASIALVLGGLVLSVKLRLLQAPWLALALAAFLCFPVALSLAHVPNVAYARYYAPCCVVLMLLQADIVARLWQRGEAERGWAAGLVSLIVVGGLAADMHDIAVGRSSPGATLDLMAREGDLTFAASYPTMAARLLGSVTSPFTDMRSVALADVCRTPPTWYLDVGTFDSRPDGAVTLDVPCHATYRVRGTFTSAALSGTQWTLYRRAS